MLKILMKTGVAIFLLCLIQNAHAQKASEIYIPVGQSPGLSGTYTTLGKIDLIDMQNKMISMSDAAGNYGLKITDGTQIWLDQSLLSQKNQMGSIHDIKIGMQAEVKYMDNKKGGDVEWIKIQLVQ